MENPHLISVDELRAAGALDVPASWREMLHVGRDLFLNFADDEDDRDSSAADGAAEDEGGGGEGPVPVRFAG